VAILKWRKSWASAQLARASAIDDVLTIPAGGPAVDGLDAFGSETDVRGEATVPPAATPVRGASAVWLPTAAKWAGVLAIGAVLGAAGMFGYERRVGHQATTGTVTLLTEPEGLDVSLAGRLLGKTPLTATLTPGSYDVQVGEASTGKKIAVTVEAGGTLVHQIDFSRSVPALAAATGGLRILTDPARLPVTVDGVPRGVSPISLDDMQPGNHQIAVRTTSGIVRRTAPVQPREIASLLIVASSAPPAEAGTVSAGWVTVSSPVILEMREAGKLIGNTETSRLLLPTGQHDIDFENKTLGFSTRRSVRVTAGKTTATNIDLPNGLVSVNALPWAEVWIDGERIGETPIGNLSRQIGSHEVLFRHPQLGERRETVIIAAGKPARIGVDLRKK
jgi:hypothetical protein